MPLLSRKRAILAKTESSYGVDSTPTGAANAILVRNLDIKPIMQDYVPRELVRPYLGNFENLPDEAWVECTFEVEVAGGGAAGTAPAYGPLLTACAMLETISAGVSVTYSPQSDDSLFKSVVIYFSVDGILHKITGARGTVDVELNIKSLPVYKFRFVGIYNLPTDTADPTPTYTGFQVPLIAGKTNTPTFALHGFSGVLAGFGMNVANELVQRALIGGTKQVHITGRQTTGSFLIEAPTMAAKDFYSTIVAATKGALSLIHGTAAGNRVTFSAPASSLQLIEPTLEDSDGIQMLRMNANYTPISGNDEFSIVVS